MLPEACESSFHRDILAAATGLVAILGHDFSPFLHFKGGKGVNTTVGSFLILAPMPTAIAVGFYFILGLATGIVSVRSIALGIVLPIAVGCFPLASAGIPWFGSRGKPDSPPAQGQPWQTHKGEERAIGQRN